MNVKTLIMTCMMLVTKVRLMSSTLISLATSCGSNLCTKLIHRRTKWSTMRKHINVNYWSILKITLTCIMVIDVGTDGRQNCKNPWFQSFSCDAIFSFVKQEGI